MAAPRPTRLRPAAGHRKAEAAAAGRGGGADGQRIVEVHHGEIVGRLRGEDSRLGVGVGLDPVVAIEVIGGDVEQRGDARMESVGRLELKAGGLDHAEAAVSAAGVPTASASGSPRLPPTKVGRPRRAQHVADQRRGGRLAVGAGDRDDRRRDEPRGQLHLAGDGHARRPRGGQLRDLRDARRQHDQIGAAGRSRAVPAQLAGTPAGSRARAAARAVAGRLSVAVTRAPRAAQSARRRDPGAPETDHQTRLSRELDEAGLSNLQGRDEA